MAKIKTRETVKTVKAIDKAAVASQRMKDAFVRTKDQAENLMDDGQVSPSEYAEDKIRYAAEDVAQDAGRTVSSGAKKVMIKGTIKTTAKSIKTAEKTSKAAIKTAQTTAKATQKAAQSSVKAAQAAKATAKAAVATAKAAAKEAIP